MAPVTISLGGAPDGISIQTANPTVLPGTPQQIMLAAGATAKPGPITVVLEATAVKATSTTTFQLTVVPVERPTPTAIDVTTFHNNVARDGLNAHETGLTLSNVEQTFFGKIGFDTVDGKIDASPLYVSKINIGGKERNVLYVATEHDSLYAFDADSGAQLWRTSVVGKNETPVSNPAGGVAPEIGITSTPVIDRTEGANGKIFLIAMIADANGVQHHRLHALDLVDGSELLGATEIIARYPGTGDNSIDGDVVFDPAQYFSRPALLLVNGVIYCGWTPEWDRRPYTAWVMGYSESTLQQVQVLDLTPNGNMGGIWMSGGGMSADGAGNIYLTVGNGTFDTTIDRNGFPAYGDFGNAMLKLSVVNGKLTVDDYFAAYDTIDQIDNDLDFGAGGVVLLPDVKDANGKVHHLVVGAGKDAKIYLADRDNLGKFNVGGSENSNLYQELVGAVGKVFSTPAYFNGVLYYAAAYDDLKAFPFVNGRLLSTASSSSATSFWSPGGTPSISANGVKDGIVWITETPQSAPAVLHAYDAADLSHELYNSSQAPNGRDSFGNANKFTVPLIDNGKVYVPTPTGVAVFGLFPAQ